MPLLRRHIFEREKPPANLRPDEEVFYCKMTNEIFRDYEEFFERIILCNSLVWSCSITGRSGMTFQEALECESRAKKHLATFPSYLEKPILYLASLTHRSRLVDVNDDVFVYAKDRFFKGEIVDVLNGSMRKVCKIMKVVLPNMPQLLNGSAMDSSETDGSEVEEIRIAPGPASKKALNIKPSHVQYVVLEEGSTSTIIVKAEHVARRKGIYTRDKSKLYLKQHCEPENGLWKVKDSIMKKNGLQSAKFDDFFAGPPPFFAHSPIKKKTNAKKLSTSASDTSPVAEKKKRKKSDEEEKPKKKLMKKEKVERAPPVLPDEGLQHMTKEERMAMREKEKEEKKLARLAQKEQMRKQLEVMKEKMKEEKAKEREKLREEKKKQVEIMKEWSRPREDLECDDLVEIPQPTPIQTKMSPELFGEAVMTLEFLHAFVELFDQDDQFPGTFTLESMERALTENDISSPLTDLLKFLLTTLFNLQEEEEEEELELRKGEENKADATDLADEDYGNSDLSTKQLIQTATAASLTPQLYHGSSLRRMAIDTFTVTEVLRLHFMSAGARVGAKNNKFRYQQRGGYTTLDDPGLEFKQNYPAIMRNLAVSNVFDLLPEEKVQIIMTLVNQFLTYATSRDFMEDNFERIRQQRMDLKQLQWAELRREREEAHARYRKKMEEKAKERERMAELRALKLKEKGGVAQEGEHTESVEKGVGLAEPADVKKPDVPRMSPHAVKKFMRDLDGKVVSVLQRDNKPQRQRSKKGQQEESQTIEELLADMDKVDEDQLDPEEIEKFRFKREELEIRRKEDYVHKEKELSEGLLKLQAGNAIYPIGRDRFYRRYWIFRSIPGLFVENNDEFIPEYMFENGKNPSLGSSYLPLKCESGKNCIEDKSTSSDKENESFELTNGNATPKAPMMTSKTSNSVENEIPVIDLEPPELETDSGSAMLQDEKPPELDLCVDRRPSQQRVMWSYISSPEQFDVLLQSLNMRGFREGALKHCLQEQKLRVMDSIRNCPQDSLQVSSGDQEEEARKPSLSKLGGKLASNTAARSDCAQELLELNLRDMLLEIEERIYVGSLGSMKVRDRLKWRDAIERGGYDPETDDPTFALPDDAKDNDRMSDSSESFVALVRDLAMALLQIERGLEPKFLVKPLGENDNSRKSKHKGGANKKKVKNEKKAADSDAEDDEDGPKAVLRTTLERWEESLLQSTSLSQIYLYLATLERSIAWSKSALHARCRICRRKGDGEKMLLCDGCDRGHHMYCLKPAVKHIPQGDWFCPECRPKEIRTPRKGRRRTFSEETDEEAASDEEEEEEEEAEDGSDEDSSEEEAVCEVEEEEDNSENEEDVNDNTCTICRKGGKLLCCDNCPLSYHLRCAVPPLSKVPKGKWLCQACKKAESRAGKIKISKVSKSKKSTPTSSQSGSRRNSPLTVKPSGRSKRRHSDTDQDAGASTSKPSGKHSRLSLQPDTGADSDSGTPKSLSSYRGNSKVQQMKVCEDMVNDLMREDAAWPFLKPVSKKLVPDYHEIISHPMDFSTIRNRINKYEYTDPQALLADVRLIFQNCEVYNVKTSPEYKAGMKLQKLLEKRVHDLGLSQEDTASGGGPKKRPRRH